MDDEKRTRGLLEMASQHMERFHDLEEIEWKINFSIWALLGGIGYLWVSGHMTIPAWLKSPCAFLVAPIPAMLLHGLASFMLHMQEQTEAGFRNHYRDEAEELLSKSPIPKDKFYSVCGLRGRYWRWIAWEVAVTLILSEAVLLLMWTTAPPPK
jgi:hypothetical protein